MILISQVRFHPLHTRALPQVHADLTLFIARVKHNDYVRAILVDISGAVKVAAVADADTVSIRTNVAREVRERPCTFGDFVGAVLDFDKFFVFVVVCVAVLDDEPPVFVWVSTCLVSCVVLW